MSTARPRARLALVASLLLIAAATLVPHPEQPWPHKFWCVFDHCGLDGRPDAIEFALNIALFVPLGFALRWANVSARRAVLVVVGTTVFVEVLQYTLVPGREGTIRDCISNSIGGLSAFALGGRLASLWSPQPHNARRLAWAAAFLWVWYASFSMVAIRPAMTPYRDFAQLAPELGQFDVFRGTVPRARVNGALVFGGPFPEGVHLGDAEPLELSAIATLGPAPARLAPIFSIFDAEQNEIALLGQRRRDLVFRTRTRADELGLRVPALVVSDALPDTAAPGLLLRVEGVRERNVLRARVLDSLSQRRSASLALTPSVGWMFWWRWEVPPRPLGVFLTFLWLALPMAAIGFWSRKSLHSPRASRIVALLPLIVAILGAHIIIPFAFHAEAYGTWIDIAAIIAGAFAGLALGAWRQSGSRA